MAHGWLICLDMMIQRVMNLNNLSPERIIPVFVDSLLTSVVGFVVAKEHKVFAVQYSFPPMSSNFTYFLGSVSNFHPLIDARRVNAHQTTRCGLPMHATCL